MITDFGLDRTNILKTFLCKFEPWEVEEICCIYTFSKAKYDQIFNNISWDLDERNPKYDKERPGTPPGTFELGQDGQSITSPTILNLRHQSLPLNLA